MGARLLRLFAIVLTLAQAMAFGQAVVKKVSRAEAISAVLARTQPDYPPMARQLKIEGTVELEAVIAESGVVEEVSIVSGNPILTKPAAEAVKKWKFTPFTQDGKNVKAAAPITIIFRKQ